MSSSRTAIIFAGLQESKQRQGTMKSLKFKRTHPTSEGRGGEMTESAAGRTERRWREEMSITHNLPGKICDITQAYSEDISGNTGLILEGILRLYEVD